MANLTITTTQKQDAAVQYVTQQFNARMNPPTPLTPLQFAQQAIQDLINSWVTRADTEQGITKGAAYQQMTPADRAIVDPIFAKYGA